MRIEIERIQGKRLQVRSTDSELIVDRLAEDGGPGDGWRPSELVMAGLGACMVGTMLDFAANQGIEVTSVSLTATDTAADRPKRIGAIDIDLRVDGDVTDRQLESLRRSAGNCKIHNTLANGPEIRLVFGRS